MVEEKQTQPSEPLYAGRLRNLDLDRLLADGIVEAFDETSRSAVLVAAEKKHRGQPLAQLASVNHAHLAKIVAVIDHGDDWLVLTKPLTGVTLGKRVKELGRKHAVDAVRTALRVADALSHLHDGGITHGRVNPDNVLLDVAEGLDPALVLGRRSPPEFERPERTSGDTPLDPRDDTWAATAILYFMLCGSPPPREGLESVKALESLHIDDSLLCEVLMHGLAKDESQRAKDLTALKRELARWFIAHAADEPIPMSTMSHKPPPLPASVAPKPRGSSPAREDTRSGKASIPTGQPLPTASSRPGWLRSLPLAMIAGVVGIGVAWGVSQVTKTSTKSVLVRENAAPAPSVPAPASSGPDTASSAIDLAEVPVGKEAAAGDPTATCCKGYLREGTLAKLAQLDGICKEAELPKALGTLRLAFASTADPALTNAARFDTLGWYALPLLSALRRACCTEPPELKLPDLGGACSEFAPALDALAHVASTTQQFDGSITKYSDAAKCAAKTGRATGVAPAAPSPVSEKAFRELFAAPTAP